MIDFIVKLEESIGGCSLFAACLLPDAECCMAMCSEFKSRIH